MDHCPTVLGCSATQHEVVCPVFESSGEIWYTSSAYSAAGSYHVCRPAGILTFERSLPLLSPAQLQHISSDLIALHQDSIPPTTRSLILHEVCPHRIWSPKLVIRFIIVHVIGSAVSCSGDAARTSLKQIVTSLVSLAPSVHAARELLVTMCTPPTAEGP